MLVLHAGYFMLLRNQLLLDLSRKQIWQARRLRHKSLSRSLLGQKHQRFGWINLAFFLVLASSGEALFCIGVDAAVARIDNAQLQKMPHQPPLETVSELLLGQENGSESVKRYFLSESTEVERFLNPSRGSAELLLGEGEKGGSLRFLQAKQPLSKSEPPPITNESNTPQTNSDPDLGILRLRQDEVPPPAPPPVSPPPKPPQRRSEPILHLLPRISFFQTNNVFSSVDPVGDSLIFPSLMLWGVPRLGPNTYLTPSIEGSLARYIKQPQFNYNLVRFRTGISQRINRQMFGEIGWTNQQFYRAEQGDRFLNEHIAYLSLSRQDQLTRQLRLSSFYEFRVSFADPDERSRVINSLYLSLNYSFQTNLQVGLDYQFERSDFTVRDRYDQYHRIMGRLTYGVLRDSQVNIVGGTTIGGSTESFLDFDSLFFSVTYSVDFPIY